MSVTYTTSGRNAKGGQVKTMLLVQVAIKIDDQIPFKSQKSDLEVFVEGPEEPKVSVLGGERGNFHVGFTPNVAGQFWLEFVYKGTVANEPFLLPVRDLFNKVPEHPYTGKFRSNFPEQLSDSSQKPPEERKEQKLEGHVVAVTFIFRALNRYGKPKSTGGDTDSFSVTANGEKITLIEDAGDGTYTVDYNCVPGNNEVDVQYKGQSIKGFPVKFFRKTDD
eukprot:TRINITY_DN4177_c0_g1_i1.p1 TRINITY_DN4177_c0_g1~~TRINITY_DN4177_c0_g1_i1.p1  ORF type:complete len:221 (+),score=45.64 TRINITY_DN4177_c0_g1_i1:16-678(+)